MQSKDQLNPPLSNFDSHINKMKIYRDKRNILKDFGNNENMRDSPDIADVQMIAFDIFQNEQLSDQHINMNMNMDEMYKKDQELKASIIEKFHKTSILLNEQQNKVKNGYEGYIEELEKENQNLKIFEDQILSIKDDIRQLEEQQITYQTQLQLLSQQKNVNPEIIATLQSRIHNLRTEKLNLLDLVNMNKIKIQELIKKVHNNQRDIFPDRSQLLREITSLETQLEQKTYITEEKVLYKEVPIRNQQEIIEEIIEYEPPVDTRQYNPNCVCQCKCQCHTTHCHGYSQHHHNLIHQEENRQLVVNQPIHNVQQHQHHDQIPQENTKQFIMNKTIHSVQQPLRDESSRSQTIKRSFKKQNYVQQTITQQERPMENQTPIQRVIRNKTRKDSAFEDETRSTSVIARQSRSRMANKFKNIRRSKSRRKQVFDMVNNKRRLIEDDHLQLEQSLDFHNYGKLMR